LVAAGATLADSASEAVANAQIVFSMLSTPEVVEEMAFGEVGFAHNMMEGALWVDCTTVNPSFSRKMEQWAFEYGIRFMDAPVAGSIQPAASGELTFLAGGSIFNVQDAKPCLQQMGKRIIHVGEEVGQGSALKMLVNVSLAQSMAVFAENLMLGQQLGIGRDFLLEFLPKLPVSPPFLQSKAEEIQKGNFDASFPLEWMHKDLHLASLTAYETGSPATLVNMTKEFYAGAKQDGLGRKDFSAIVQWLESRLSPAPKKVPQTETVHR
jgi:3-hydroxyisobutyrate dehydrogenase-like beta-hydroxyacid dehydrogenase